ncbi:MAG: cyclic nucleotide-binding domain-containing protein, partial [Thiohalorhabdaceae bacterium]
MTGQAFGHIPLFAGMAAEQLEAVAGLAVRQTYERGQLIFSQNDPGDGLYLVDSGRVKVCLAQEEEVILGL